MLIIGQGAAALAWADRLAGQLQVSVLIASDSGRADLPLQRRYPVHSGRHVKVTGYLGAFEVTWEQHNPIDLDICTRCNACIAACPENAIDYSYQIDLDKCKAHRQCVKACGEVSARFRVPRRAASFRPGVDLSADLIKLRTATGLFRSRRVRSGRRTQPSWCPWWASSKNRSSLFITRKYALSPFGDRRMHAVR